MNGCSWEQYSDERTGDEDDPTRLVGNLVGTELSAWREALDENGPCTASAIGLHDYV